MKKQSKLDGSVADKKVVNKEMRVGYLSGRMSVMYARIDSLEARIKELEGRCA